MKKITKSGLRPTPRDDRDFKMGALFELPKLSELPDEFVLEGYTIRNQGNTDFCSAFATTGASELQEGVKLSPEWAFQAGKKISGDPQAWGQDLRTACKAHVSYGDIEESESPFTVATAGQAFIRDPKNWPDTLLPKALKHKKQAYVSTTSDGADSFDTVRQSIYKWRDENRGVVFGVQFCWRLSDIILEHVTPGQGFGHAMYIVGWKRVNTVPYLVVVQSYGPDAGDKGVHLISREVFNYFQALFGSYMFIDMPREDIQYLVDNGLKQGDNWLTQMLKVMWSLITSGWLTPKEKAVTIRDTTTTLNTIADKLDPPVVPPKFLWGTPEDARHSVRVMCDEAGMAVKDKNILCATIGGESGWKISAIGPVNKDGTRDYGICQINDYWWIGPGKYFASVDEVMNNPEKSVKFMIDQYKHGNIYWWYAFTNGSYKKFL